MKDKDKDSLNENQRGSILFFVKGTVAIRKLSFLSGFSFTDICNSRDW